MNQQQINLASALLLVAIVAFSQALASPMSRSQNLDRDQDQDQDQDDLSSNEDVSSSMARSGGQSEAGNDFGGSFNGPAGGYGDESANMGQQQFNNYGTNGNSFRPSASNQQALASEYSENQADDGEDANEDDDSSADFEVGSNGNRRATARALAESAQPWLESSQLATEGITPTEGDLEGALGADSNIANAKIEMSPHDRATAAGHHHHHGHYVHGMLKMGAETGKKGAFKWHDKHPVGGKGRR